MVPRLLCGHHCESREEDGEGGQGLHLPCLCGEGETGERREGHKQVSELEGYSVGSSPLPSGHDGFEYTWMAIINVTYLIYYTGYSISHCGPVWMYN